MTTGHLRPDGKNVLSLRNILRNIFRDSYDF